MAQSHLTVMTCDRCGASETASDHYTWGRIHAEQVNGPLGIGRGGQKPIFKDVCPTCLREVVGWFAQSEDANRKRGE